MIDISGKSYAELVELRKNSVAGGDVYIQLSDEIQRIQKDTENVQTADLVDQLKNLNGKIEKYSHSSDKASRAMIYITVGLVILALAQSAIAYFAYQQDVRSVQVRRDCFHSVIQTSDVDMNYKNCLRDHGYNE